MHAHDRFLPGWFDRVRSRQITLPRFQRFIAWGPNEVAGLLTTVLRGLPSGATLILEVGDSVKFKDRTIMDAPEKGERVTEQLLDGQQRITALWRSLHDKYEERTYLVGFEEDLNNPGDKIPVVHGEARWVKEGKRFPIWVDDPKELWGRNYIPVRLLRPEDISSEIDAWIEAATSDITDLTQKYAAERDINRQIQYLRTKVREFNLPYLSLPASTPRDVALDVFIKMNTSSVKLSTYDIIVALVEEETGHSLHDHVQNLVAEVPRVKDYADVSEIVLDVTALRQDRIPNQAGYKGMDYKKMIEDWPALVASVKGLIGFLEEESIFDSQRLPSYTPLPVIAALWENMPIQPDQLGNARHLLKRYIWRAFLSDRYGKSSASNSLQDYRKLRDDLKSGDFIGTAPIFSLDLPTKEQLLNAEWPKYKTILGRGLLVLAIKCGAEDIADGAKASFSSLQNREYHHLFPASTLEEAGLDHDHVFKALNCALITWRTNRVISNKDPISYLKERSQNGSLGHDELIRRLKTHIIPFEPLSVGYDGMEGEAKSRKVKFDYANFLEYRATAMEKAIVAVCNGMAIQIDKLFSP